MSSVHPPAEKQGPSFSLYHGIALVLVSACVISLQIVLMRSLAITRFHHFSYLVIGTALMGFGMSGTFLSIFGARLSERFAAAMPLLLLLFALSMPLCSMLAEQLPIDVQYLLVSPGQFLLLLLSILLVLVPFFLGAVIIGLMLTVYAQQAPAVYGLNLFGSGAGGLLGIGLLMVLPPSSLPALLSLVSMAALCIWIFSAAPPLKPQQRRLFLLAAALGSALSAGMPFIGPQPKIDQYKALAHLERLEAQGSAAQVLSRFSARGMIDVYEAESLHRTLFAGPHADVLPPPQLSILIDGSEAGAIFRIDAPDQAGILDFTPQSLAYRLSRQPRVLLLGEIGGSTVWLARRYGAAEITVVQPDPLLNSLMQHELADLSGQVLNRPDVRVISEDPHLFIRRTRESFDIIHIVSAEAMAAGVSGLLSLHEDYFLTVEAIADGYRLLSDKGFITLTRGLQTPPRDNLKIFGLFAAALEKAGVASPGDHLLQARNYLSVNTMISRRPLDEDLIQRFRSHADDLMMDPEYFPGIQSSDSNRLNVIAGPEGAAYSYLHHGIMRILSPGRAAFFRDWAYDVRPPEEDRPYFYDFFRWRSIAAFFRAYGAQWLQRLELGSVVLAATLLMTTAAAAVFILLPLLFMKQQPAGGARKLPALFFFLAIGFGFLFIEMVFIQRSMKLLGDPIHAVSAALTSILVFSGLGSISQQRDSRTPVRRIRIAALAVSALVILSLFTFDGIYSRFVEAGIVLRFIVTVVTPAPAAFFMGWMFPNCLMILGQTSKELIPWAWGVNGFASVAAAPLSVMLTMAYGFNAVLVISAVLYLAAAYVAAKI